MIWHHADDLAGLRSNRVVSYEEKKEVRKMDENLINVPQEQKSQVLEDLRSQDSIISHMNEQEEVELFSKKNMLGTSKVITEGLFEKINRHSDTVHSEVKLEYQKLWVNDDTEQQLLANARRYDISNNKNLDDRLRPELERLTATDSHRPVKSRRKYVKNASACYKRAAKNMETIRKNKDLGNAWKIVENGESAILAVYEAEQSLIKAGGIYNANEKLRIGRNAMKCYDMLRRFYKDCLEMDGLKGKERVKLEKKLADIRKKIKRQHYGMVTHTLTYAPTSEQLAGNGLMTKNQFLRYVGKLGKENLPDDIDEIADQLAEYHLFLKNPGENQEAEERTKRLKIAEICNRIRNANPDKLKLHVALNILIKQTEKDPMPEIALADPIERQQEAQDEDYRFASNEEKNSAVQNARTNANLLQNDPYREYGYMTDMDFKTYAGKNIGNSPEGSAMIKQQKGEGSVGYLKTRNSSLINSYMRTGKVPDDVKGEPNWEDNAKETINAMKRATKDTTLKKKTRLVRMVNMKYFEHVLKIDQNLLNLQPNEQYNLSREKQEAMVADAQKFVGTVVTDQAFTSTGSKMDMPFRNLPIMMTMLCEKGQKCFVTDNFAESEIILPAGTKYTVVEVKTHAAGLKKVPTVSNERLEQMVDDFKGIEIVVKVLPEEGVPVDDEIAENKVKRNKKI